MDRSIQRRSHTTCRGTCNLLKVAEISIFQADNVPLPLTFALATAGVVRLGVQQIAILGGWTTLVALDKAIL